MNISSCVSGRILPTGSGGVFYIWPAVWFNSPIWFLIFNCHESHFSGVIHILLWLCSESFNNLTVSLENREVSGYTYWLISLSVQRGKKPLTQDYWGQLFQSLYREVFPRVCWLGLNQKWKRAKLALKEMSVVDCKICKSNKFTWVFP